MSVLTFIIVCPLVFLAGFVDAIAGGGGLISLPAYLISGLPPHAAIGTNKLSATLGTTIATFHYARKGFMHWCVALPTVFTALAGSVVGSNLVLYINEAAIKVVIMVVLPLTAAYVLWGKGLRTEKAPYSYAVTLDISLFLAFVIGMYDGFYGPGTGTFLMLLLTGVAHVSLKEAAGTTKIINLSANVAALTVFLYNGVVWVPLGLTAALFSIAGNYIGAQYFTRKGASIVKPIILVVLVIFFVKLCFEML